MSDQLTPTPSGMKPVIRLVALVDDGGTDVEPGNAGGIGYILEGRDRASLMELLTKLSEGKTPCTKMAKRVRITVHPPDEGRTSSDPCLSPREQEVLSELVKGRSYKMIANELNISFETVRSHIKGIYAKMDVNNNTAAVAKAILFGLAAA